LIDSPPCLLQPYLWPARGAGRRALKMVHWTIFRARPT